MTNALASMGILTEDDVKANYLNRMQDALGVPPGMTLNSPEAGKYRVELDICFSLMTEINRARHAEKSTVESFPYETAADAAVALAAARHVAENENVTGLSASFSKAITAVVWDRKTVKEALRAQEMPDVVVQGGQTALMQRAEVIISQLIAENMQYATNVNPDGLEINKKAMVAAYQLASDLEPATNKESFRGPVFEMLHRHRTAGQALSMYGPFSAEIRQQLVERANAEIDSRENRGSAVNATAMSRLFSKAASLVGLNNPAAAREFELTAGFLKGKEITTGQGVL